MHVPVGGWAFFKVGTVAVVFACVAVVSPSPAAAATGFGLLSGPSGCLVAPGQKSEEKGTSGCGEGKALVGANAVAVSPDGKNVYVVSGTSGSTAASSFGSLAILKRDPATGTISEVDCLSSDGTDGRDGASGACTPMPSLLDADGVALSPDGSDVFVAAGSSGSVIGFARNAETGAVSRLGCYAFRPPAGSACEPANVFFGSAALAGDAAGNALYVASSDQGSLSELLAGSGSSAEGTLSTLFSAAEPARRLLDPCIAVNGFDGSCAVGIASQGLDALTLSPDGHQLYGVASGSDAIDGFTPDASGALSESSCLKSSAPPGLCASSALMESPTQMAISPDGSDVYVADGSEDGGRVDVLRRNATTGALSDASCVDDLPEEHHGKSNEEEGEESEEEQGSAEPDRCVGVAGLESVSAVAVSGDGSAVYAIGSSSAVVFSRDKTSGKLTEVSCAASEDERCTSFPSLEDVRGLALSSDGREIYVAAGASDSVMAFGLGSTIASASASTTRRGSLAVRIDCPSVLRRPCAGHLDLTRTTASAARGRHRRRIQRSVVATSRHYRIAPGHRANVSLRPSRLLRRLLAARHRLRLTAVVRADPLAGGSGYGRHLLVELTRH